MRGVTGPDFIEALARGLDVIRAFEPNRPTMTLSEVAAATGLTRPTARRMLLTLEFLRIGELAPGREDALLRFQRRRIGSDRLGRSGGRRGNARDALCRFCNLHSGDKALEIAFLLGVEIARSRLVRRRCLACSLCHCCELASSIPGKPELSAYSSAMPVPFGK